MKIGIITYAFMLAGDLHRLLSHVLNETDAQVYLFLHSQNGLVVKTCEDFACDMRVHYYPYGVNRGLGRSCNEALIDGYGRDGMDVMMTANDDLIPAAGDIECIARAAVENREYYTVTGMGVVGGRNEDVGISLGAINPIALETIGYYDPNFFPAYYEDVDYERRAMLAGLRRLSLPDTHIVHSGSSSLPHVPKDTHDAQFKANQDYYARKWGGEMGQETYSIPFNNDHFTLKISAENVLNPYPGYNREDMPK